MTPRFASRIAIANSVLVGWNSGLLCAFLIAILIGVMFNTFADGIDDSWRIATAILVAVIVGIFCGYTEDSDYCRCRYDPRSAERAVERVELRVNDKRAESQTIAKLETNDRNHPFHGRHIAA